VTRCSSGEIAADPDEGDIPVEQPTKFDKALGLMIPPSLRPWRFQVID